ncbi:Exosome RNA helicase MTR4 [Dermatophagoides farinae]|uniref:Exosome RNA helicase MTR4 n=1 Tax=Dermatophagoides farinae TaxID=6954 RepID=A0A922HTF0_DERFA|nr:Exosome RNA helicase MTR4 [Dermatophagoides farinae]
MIRKNVKVDNNSNSVWICHFLDSELVVLGWICHFLDFELIVFKTNAKLSKLMLIEVNNDSLIDLISENQSEVVDINSFVKVGEKQQEKVDEKVNEKSYDLIGVRTNDVIDNKSGVVTGTGEHNMNDCDDLTWDCTSFEYYRNRFKRRMLQQIVLRSNHINWKRTGLQNCNNIELNFSSIISLTCNNAIMTIMQSPLVGLINSLLLSKNFIFTARTTPSELLIASVILAIGQSFRLRNSEGTKTKSFIFISVEDPIKMATELHSDHHFFAQLEYHLQLRQLNFSSIISLTCNNAIMTIMQSFLNTKSLAPDKHENVRDHYWHKGSVEINILLNDLCFEMDLFDVFDLDQKSNDIEKSNDNGEKKLMTTDEDVDNGLIDKSIKDVKRNKDNDENLLITSMIDEWTITPDDTDDHDDENLGQYYANFTARVAIHKLETQGSCVHEVVIHDDLEYVPLRDHSGNPIYMPAKSYKFPLDSFQKEAILCIENNQSVLVSAHTSAALSNQKYREFKDEFEDVGLITGDVTINQNATCLIMTTEILRLMLFRRKEIIRQVGWVIFDEIHYMRDRERGVIWEETIILLPDTVHYVFLSATIPNARQFAEWIAYLHHQSCHIVYTDFRPTPLKHYIYPAGGGGDELYLVLDEQNNFSEENFNTAMNVLKNSSSKVVDPSCIKIIPIIMKRNLAPVILFCFSRKQCERYALEISILNLDYNSAEEKTLVEEVFNNATDKLSDEDKKLPQVQQILPLLKRGVGIHHSGLLPLIKEMIEILFGKSLIKVLFATETIGMGLNMPARTVVFTSVRKFDGRNSRFLTSSEYIQMSGRAGRRGFDERGIVICQIDKKNSPILVEQMICGKPETLNSAFHLTYNMVLNLSLFFQFQQYLEYHKLDENLSHYYKEFLNIGKQIEFFEEELCRNEKKNKNHKHNSTI